MDIQSYLIMPVQRLPRYRLLLEDLIKNTNGLHHKDYRPLIAACEEIKKVANFINEQKKEAENMNRVLEIQSLLSGLLSNQSLFTNKRRILKEGKFNLDKGTVVDYFLFNDLLIIAEQKLITVGGNFNIVCKAYLRDLALKESPAYIELVLQKPKGSFVIRFPTPEEQKQWVQEFHVSRSKALMEPVEKEIKKPKKKPKKDKKPKAEKTPEKKKEEKPKVKKEPSKKQDKKPTQKKVKENPKDKSKTTQKKPLLEKQEEKKTCGCFGC